MSAPIPRAALVLGLAGLIPFVVGAALGDAPAPIVAYASGDAILRIYGLAILSFMAGCLWGFAASEGSRGGAATMKWLGLSVIPTVAVFVAFIVVPGAALNALLAAFPALLILDYLFVRAGLAPPWWMRLRLILTAVVAVCLAIAVVS